MDRWSGLMSPELRLELEPSDLKSLELLENVVSNSETVEVIKRDCSLLFRSGQAEITLNVLETFSRRLIANNHHLAITIGVNGFPEYHREVWIFGPEGSLAAECCVTFLLMAGAGFPGQFMPQHLDEEIERANKFADDDDDDDDGGNENEK